MSHPLFTPEESARQAKKLSDAINQAITETFSAGLSENRRKLTPEQHAEMFGPDCPLPAEIEPPVEPKQRRKAREVSRVLSILDELGSEARP